MSELANRALRALEQAERDAEEHEAQVRHSLRATDTDVLDAYASALRTYVDARRQYVEAKRIAEWNRSQVARLASPGEEERR
jgi:hypothetical protein